LTAVTLAVAVGCGGGSFSAASPDGGVEAGGEASADTGAEGSVAEGSSHWCDSRPERFCEDFDEETDVNAFLSTWTTNQSTNGSFTFDTSSTVPSAPNALHVTGTSGAQVTVVRLLPTLPQHEKKVLLAFELRINQSENISGLSAAGFAAIVYGKDLTDGYVALAIGNGPMLEAVGASPADAGAGTAGIPIEQANSGTFPAPATWAARYTLEIDFTQTPPCASVYAGTTALLGHCMALPSSLAVPTEFAIVLGDYSGGFTNTGTVDLEFDNVTFDASY
jgi:hypothetical protein